MDPARMILLAIEDDQTSEFLAENLKADGYAVITASDKTAALARLAAKVPDLVILDINGDTLGVLDTIRTADGVASRVRPDTPLIVLTSQVESLSHVRFLDRGSDDVIVKPFSYPELRARVRAVLQRAYGGRAGCWLIAGPLRLDPVSRQVEVDGEPVQLSSKEYALLRALATEPTRVWTKEELLRSVWGFKSFGVTRTLDSHACRLRKKLNVNGCSFVINVWGIGYRLLNGPAIRESEDTPPIEPAAARAA
jgi:DNA-binding response OmpR family regulator